MKKASGDVIILQMCIKNHNHMMYAFWVRSVTIFCHFGPFFALLPHYWLQKIKFQKNVKKKTEILSFSTQVPWMKIIWWMVKSSQLFSDIRIYIHKKIQFSITEINTEIKTTATAVIKNELKYFLMSEGNTCIAEPKLEVLPFIWFSKGLV